jgi:chromosome segregation ATPase
MSDIDGFIVERNKLRAEIERLRGALLEDNEFASYEKARLVKEIERLRAHYADEQQRLFHYERSIAEQRAEIERLRSALLAMRERDDQNGSLPDFYRSTIDAALGAPGRKTG